MNKLPIKKINKNLKEIEGLDTIIKEDVISAQYE